MKQRRAGASLRALAAGTLGAAVTATQAVEVGTMIKGGYDAGGDSVVRADFTDGSTRSIKANQGFYSGGGVSILNDDETLEAELSLSYKVTILSASNGKASFTRLPLDALAFYRWPKLRVGGGLTYHIHPSIDGSGSLSEASRSFDNAAGFVLQGDYLFTRKLSVGVRYANIEYKQRNPSASFRGDGAGVAIGYRF